jgi:hypothetical protein
LHAVQRLGQGALGVPQQRVLVIGQMLCGEKAIDLVQQSHVLLLATQQIVI